MHTIFLFFFQSQALMLLKLNTVLEIVKIQNRQELKIERENKRRQIKELEKERKKRIKDKEKRGKEERTRNLKNNRIEINKEIRRNNIYKAHKIAHQIRWNKVLVESRPWYLNETMRRGIKL